MSDYIDRDALVGQLLMRAVDAPDRVMHTYMRVVDLIERMPAAEVVPAVHGKWLPNRGLIFIDGRLVFPNGVMCSICHTGYSGGNYCESCGARMEK